MKKKKSRSDNIGGFFFAGPLMMGIGLGIYYNQVAVGTLVGLGAGFILFGLAKIFVKD